MRGGHDPLGTDLACRWKHLGLRTEAAHSRPRVLVEESEVARAYATWRLLDNNGCEASWCRGPRALSPRPCPLVVSGRCELVECADVVVSSLGLHRESSRMVVAALRRLHPEIPVVVQVPRQALARWAPMFEGHWGSVQIPATRRTLLDSVQSALAKPIGESPDRVDAHLLPNVTDMVNSFPDGQGRPREGMK